MVKKATIKKAKPAKKANTPAIKQPRFSVGSNRLTVRPRGEKFV